MADGRWRNARTHAAAIILAATLMIEMLMFGADGALLAIVAAVMEITAAIAILILLRPTARFWAGAWPVLAVVALILLWFSLPGLGLIAAPPGERLAPDLLKPGLARLFGACAVLLAAGWIGYRRGMMRVTVDWLLVFAGLQMMIAFALREYDPEHVWGWSKGIMDQRFTGTFLNANASGCLFGVVAVLATGRLLALLRERTIHDTGLWPSLRRVLCLLAAMGALGACAITGSRSALVLTCLAIAGLALADRVLRGSLRSTPGMVAGAVSVAAAIAILLTAGEVTLDRFRTVGDDGGDRVALLTRYAQIAGHAPLAGHGLLSFPQANLRTLGTPHEALSYWYVNAAHNKLIGIAIEGGLPAVLLIALATMLMIVTILRNHRGGGEDDPVLRAIGAALVLMFGCAMVDIALDVPALAALAIALLAMLWGRAIRIAADRQRVPDAARG